MRIVPILAAGIVLGALPATEVSAAPAFPQPGALAGRTAKTVDWHPSTRHWDHHFHAHQRSLGDRPLTEAEQRIDRMLGRTDHPTRNPARSGSYDRFGSRADRAYD